MKKWEYKATTEFGESAELGLEGWELVSVVAESWGPQNQSSQTTYYFKRPVPVTPRNREGKKR